MKNKVPCFFSHQIGKIESRLVIFSYGEVCRGKTHTRKYLLLGVWIGEGNWSVSIYVENAYIF